MLTLFFLSSLAYPGGLGFQASQAIGGYKNQKFQNW